MAATLTAAERPARSARKAKGEGHARRGEILQAAERLFVDCGYEGATIRKIADEVGVSSTALYMHFRDKSEILLEICEAGFADLKQDLALVPEVHVERGRGDADLVRDLADCRALVAAVDEQAFGRLQDFAASGVALALRLARGTGGPLGGGQGGGQRTL